jgi:hypothetical protein
MNRMNYYFLSFLFREDVPLFLTATTLIVIIVAPLDCICCKLHVMEE